MPRNIIARNKNNSSAKRIKMDIETPPINQPTTDVPFYISNNINGLINQLEKIKIEIDNLINMNKP